MKPVSDLTNRELRDEIEHIVAMMMKAKNGGIGTTLSSRVRIAAVVREAARRMRPRHPATGPGKE